MKEKIRKEKYFLICAVILAVIAICAGVLAYQYHKNYRIAQNNKDNMAFFEVVDYMENVESYLAKSLITKEAGSSAENLIQVWRETNLAQSFLSQIPVSVDGLSKTQKFLNQVSEYSYSLFRKNLKGENLTEDELKKLTELHEYSMELKNTLNQLSEDLNEEKLKWQELERNPSIMFEKETDNPSKDGFDTIESNFEQYDGLIYDGAFSEHITKAEKKGLTGTDIEEKEAQTIAEDFVGKDTIKNITADGLSENGTIQCYTFTIVLNQENTTPVTVAVSKKGGHLVFSNYNREVNDENLSEEQADDYAKKFLEERGYKHLEKTYYSKESNIMTFNYAYTESDVIVYPDLIKIKVALDNGDVLGVETTGFLNNHEERNVSKQGIISKEKAMENINQDLEIKAERLAIIPTEFKTEIFCWEIKGRVNDRDFLVYVNAKTGKIENVLVITEMQNGILAM